MFLVFTALNVVTLNHFSKLPLLVVHYIDHHERDHGIDFMTFLDMHYFGHDANDHDETEDSKLPLKSFNLNSLQPLTLFPSGVSIVFHPHFYPIIRQTFVGVDPSIPSQVLSSLFRPPRIAG